MTAPKKTYCFCTGLFCFWLAPSHCANVIWTNEPYLLLEFRQTQADCSTALRFEMLTKNVGVGYDSVSCLSVDGRLIFPMQPFQNKRFLFQK